jgi:hypothetical protein
VRVARPQACFDGEPDPPPRRLLWGRSRKIADLSDKIMRQNNDSVGEIASEAILR